jgi:23S rRNA pseudouridine1911/1915/1917 synthase
VGHPEPESATLAALTIAAEQAGATLAALVRQLLPQTSWSRARALCREGRVEVDGRIATDPALRPAAGSRVELRLAGSAARRGPELLVHADADLAVVRKPAGILTVPFEGGERDTLLALARVELRRREAAQSRALSARSPRRGGGDQAGRRGATHGGLTLRAVQRLDKETSGLVVFARTVAAQRSLQEQLAHHSLLRRYLAIAHGEVADASYESWLVEDRGDGLRGSWGVFRPARETPPEAARLAITHVAVVERLRGATLVACELETGRQHQIRIHLAEAGHPLVGETVYIRGYRGPRHAAPRLMLHAAALGFRHPRGGKTLLFEEPPPADFTTVLERLRPAGRGG